MTAVAVHTDIAHFFSNAIFLAFFSYLLFGYFGFWVFPVLGLALAGSTRKLAPLGRLELPTNGLGNRCSVHLSYRGILWYQ